MALGVYSISLQVSALYFIGPDARVKFFPDGINPFDSDGTPEPLGVACVECIETKKYLMHAFRIVSGLDVGSLLALANSPGVLGLSPSSIIFPESLKQSITVSDRHRIKKEIGVSSVSFTRLDSSVGVELGTYAFVKDMSEIDHLECNDIARFISGLNVVEYERAIQRTVKLATDPKKVNSLYDLRVASAMRLHIPKSEWRAPADVHVFTEKTHCVVRDSNWIVDECAAIDIPAGEFEKDFNDIRRSMFDEDCAGDNNDLYSYEDAFTLLLTVTMISCCEYGWPDLEISLDDIHEILEDEESISADDYEALKSIIRNNCIFVGVDCENVIWPVNEIDYEEGEVTVLDLVPPRHNPSRPRYVITIFESGILHLFQINGLAYDKGELADLFGSQQEIDFDRINVKASTYSAITQLISLAKTPESMDAAIVLIKTLLTNEEPDVAVYIAMFDE